MGTVATDPLVGHLVDGRYEVVSRIARGGMATVYHAVDQRLGRDVALKVMHPHLADGASGSAFISRFRREARSAARLTHPGIVAVYDQGLDGETSYLTMEYVNGSTLRHILQERETLTLQEVFDALDRVLDALSAAHRTGVIHRDIKPENVLVDPEGRLKVTDFGLARAITDVTSTTTGTILGTVAYLAPELIATGRCDTRADVYAVGILAYEMIVGRPPYQGPSPIQVAYQHVNCDVPAPSDLAPWLPPCVDEMVAALTSRDPDKRPADAAKALELVRATRAQVTAAELARRVEMPAALRDPKAVPPTGTRVLSSAQVPSAASPQGTQVLSAEELAATAQHTAEAAENGAEGETVPVRSPKAQRKRTIFVWTIVALAAIAAAAIGAALWFTVGPGAYVRVPQGLVGTSQSTAVDRLHASGLTPTTTRAYDDKTPAGSVVSSDPAPGARIHKGGSVQLVISQGVKMLTVPPDLVGQDSATATAALKDAGFTLSPSRSKYSDDVSDGDVLAVVGPNGDAIDAGTRIPHTTAVQLVVSKGPAPVKVPQVTGLTTDQATTALKEAGLKVTTSQEASDTVPEGTVIRQTPEGNTEAHRTDTVALVVSSGPSEVALPNTVNSNVKDATKTLKKAGFNVKVEHPQGIHLFNRVTGQSPQGGDGKTAPKGSTVTLEVF